MFSVFFLLLCANLFTISVETFMSKQHSEKNMKILVIWTIEINLMRKTHMNFIFTRLSFVQFSIHLNLNVVVVKNKTVLAEDIQFLSSYVHKKVDNLCKKTATIKFD